MNKATKLMLSGRSGITGISYAYDARGRVTQMRNCNFAVDRVTTTTYNEHGDKSEERSTVTGNKAVPIGTAYSIDENGNLIPDKRNTELTESPDLSGEEEVRYAYQYDSCGNWTQLTVNHSFSPDTYVCHRKLTYY